MNPVVLLLALGLLAPVAPPGGDVHLAFELRDGSLVSGSGPDGSVALLTYFGRLSAKLSDLERIEFHEDRETATVTTRTGDVVHGVVEPGVFVLRTKEGAARRLTAPEIRSVRLTPPVAIRGSEGARWEIELDGARGWETSNEDGALVVTGIDPVSGYGPAGARWALARVGRAVPSLGDFSLSTDVAWDAGRAGPRAVHRAFVSLLDRDGDVVAAAGPWDMWVASTGCRYSQLPGVAAFERTGEGSLPAAGKARIEIERTGEEIVVRWDGVVVQRGRGAAPVTRVEVVFGFYEYHGSHPRGPSAPGRVSIERLTLGEGPLRRLDPVGTWRHAVDGSVTGTVEIRPDGTFAAGGGGGTWTCVDGALELRWPRRDAPGGAWVDRLRLSDDGRRYAGRNQIGNVITGERVEETDEAE